MEDNFTLFRPNNNDLFFCFFNSRTGGHVDLDAVSIHGDDELDDIDKEIKGLGNNSETPKDKDNKG